MKTRNDLIDHVTGTTGLARTDVVRVVDAAFAFVRASALAGDGVRHPSLGAVKVVTRTGPDGEARTVYRFNPNPKGGKGHGRTGKAGTEAP